MLFPRVLKLVLIVALLLMGIVAVPGLAAPEQPQAPLPPFAVFQGVLQPGESISPIYQLFGTASRDTNLRLVVSDGEGALALQATNSQSAVTFAGDALGGETLWQNLVLTQGVNTFELTNTGNTALNYAMQLFAIDQTPYDWAGESAGAGTWASAMHLNFPMSGLYRFDYGVDGGRYQFFVDGEYIQKTVESSGSVTYYVEAGVHTLQVVQDTQAAMTAWTLHTEYVGGMDALPYMHVGGNLGGEGNDFGEEWLPIALSATQPVNFRLELGGDAADRLNVAIETPEGVRMPVLGVEDAYGSETLWWTSDLPAGVSRLYLTANISNTQSLTYSLTAYAQDSGSAAWSGYAKGEGNPSTMRINVPEAGLYDFDYAVGEGRFQFMVDEYPHVLKTAEADGSVRYYMAAGVHEVAILQDAAQPFTAWSLSLAPAGVPADSLPYQKMGGDLGGADNLFGVEVLPIYLPEGMEANFRLTVSGGMTDSLMVDLYHGQSETPAYSIDAVYGGEEMWWSTPFAAGANYLVLRAADGNLDALTYAIEIVPVFSAGMEMPVAWDGMAAGAGEPSFVRVNTQTAGLYHLEVTVPQGFANLLITAPGTRAPMVLRAPNADTHLAFDLPLQAGAYVFTVQHSAGYDVTEWSAALTLVQPNPLFATYEGTLQSGETIEPLYQLFELPMLDVNLRLTVSGEDGVLLLRTFDAQGQQTFENTILDGEVLWQNLMLTAGDNAFELTNLGAATLTFRLDLYAIEQTPYAWAGESAGAGTWASAIHLNFPMSGLYRFDYGVDGGRYQFFVDGEYIQKTVEASGSVTYYVEAGVHTLQVVQDTQAAMTAWTLHTEYVGGMDALPYLHVGGNLGGEGNDFGEEWLPIALSAAQPVNFRLELGGDAADRLNVAIETPEGTRVPVLGVEDAYGSETLWWTSDLPAGVSRLYLMTNISNTQVLTYSLTAYAQDSGSAAWSGYAKGEGNASTMRINVPEAGLYDFDYAVGEGRFQFMVDEYPHVLKTAEADGSVRYYMAAGVHEVAILQDAAQPFTAWSLSLTPSGIPADSLPYHKEGGNLGGADNLFGEEVLPIYLPEGMEANFRLTVSGGMTDSLMVDLYHGQSETPSYSIPAVYGGEELWWSAALESGANYLALRAADGNLAALTYEIEIVPVFGVYYYNTVVWNGIAAGMGQNSFVRIDATLPGLYHIALDVPAGFANIFIENMETRQVTALRLPSDGTTIEFDAPLPAGQYIFRVEQSPNYEFTPWSASVYLKESDIHFVFFPIVRR